MPSLLPGSFNFLLLPIFQHILTSYLTKKRRKGSHHAAGANSLRSYHLGMMIESLWNLEDYAGSLSWTEIAVHEAIEARDKKSTAASTEENVEKVTLIKRSRVGWLSALNSCSL